MGYILILTYKRDVHADAVIIALKDKGMPVIRLNTEDFRDNKIIFSNGKKSWFIATPENRIISEETIKGVYVRRISPINVEDVDKEYQKFARDESSVVLNCLNVLLRNKLWFDDPSDQSFASNKLTQLIFASECGLKTPLTLVTNYEEEFRYFLKSKESIIYKTLCRPVIDFDEKGISIINTSLIKSNHLTEIENLISVNPNLFQEEIKKKYELRVHIIGEKLIAIKIDSQKHPEAKVDWRKAHFNELEYSLFSLPQRIESKLLHLMSKLGIRLGIADLIVSSFNEFVFLEVNPTGNWLWIEEKIDIPISRYIADFILDNIK